MGPFTALLLRPQGAGPFPAIVALHGCGGLLNKEGELARRETDWAKRLVGAGYVVLFPDSFTARGLRQICTAHDRTIFPKDRADDVAAADGMACQAALCRQQAARPHGLVARGHDHAVGGAAGLHGRRPAIQDGHRLLSGLPRDRQASPIGARALPLTVLIGGADDWTQPGPCRELAQRAGFKFIEYPGAYHGFDAPKSKVRVRKGLGAVKGGEAHVGTDPVARACRDQGGHEHSRGGAGRAVRMRMSSAAALLAVVLAASLGIAPAVCAQETPGLLITSAEPPPARATCRSLPQPKADRCNKLRST